jgi:hypothetical protein
MNQQDERDERPACIRFPVDLYEEVAQVAKREHRSFTGQVLYFAEQGLRGRHEVAA